VATLQKAVELQPDLPESLNNLGVALGAVGKHKEAHSKFLEATRMRPDWAEAKYNLTLSYLELGDRDDARQQLFTLDRLDLGLAEKARKILNAKFVIDASGLK
jgi:Flp pilus assembly protein TadD